MEESILTSVKLQLGLVEEITSFDPVLIIHINTVFDILWQLGVEKEFAITGENETWSDYLSDMSKLQMIKTYMYLKVRMIFDPPTGGVADAFNRQINELEWRINHQVETKAENNNDSK